MTVVVYHDTNSGSHIPSPILNYLSFVLKERTSGQVVSTFADHLIRQGEQILSRKPSPVPQGGQANSANSTTGLNPKY